MYRERQKMITAPQEPVETQFGIEMKANGKNMYRDEYSLWQLK